MNIQDSTALVVPSSHDFCAQDMGAAPYAR
jgi:hypothetical protein